MTPVGLARGLRQESADARAAFLRALTADDVQALEGALVAVLLCDTSLQARELAEQRLGARPAARQQQRPAPPAGLDDAQRRRRVASEAHDPAFVAALLAYPRGRELLTAVSLDEHPLDDLLLRLARETDDPQLLRTILALPLDVSGRAGALLVGLARGPTDVRQELLDTLTWAALQEAGELGAEERQRASAALRRWAEALSGLAPAAPGAGEATPAWEAFLEAGGTIGRGPVSEAVPLPGPIARRALGPLARCLHLLLAPSGALLERAALEPDLGSPLAELRVAGWSRLLQEGLASPEEVAGVAAAEPAPGAAAALLDALPGDLPPATRAPLARLLAHPRASVRRAAAEALARSPLVAALCAADLDPRAPAAPLGLLAALPPALRDPLLCAWLLGPRPPAEAARALTLLERPPGPGWEGWSALLVHPDPALRADAAAALGRLPASEGPALGEPLRALLALDPRLGLPLAARFGLPETVTAAATALLAGGAAAEAGAEALARAPAGDPTAWAALWEATLRRGVPTAARRRALAALLERRAPVGSEAPRLPDGSAPAWLPARATPEAGPWSARGALTALLGGRDPDGLRLACEWLLARGVPAGDWSGLEARTRQLLRAARRGPVWRALLTGLCRLLRGLLGRWIPAPWPARGRAGTARGLGALLELQLRGGVSTLEPAELRPLLGHPLPALRDPARRLYVALLGPWALPRLLDERALEPGEEGLADEALRTGHPDQVEARLLLGLRARGPAREQALRRAAARPSAGLAPALAPFLAERPLHPAALDALRALPRVPGGAEARARLVEAELRRAVGQATPEALAGAAELVSALQAWELAPLLVPGLERAGEAPRERIGALLRAASDAGARVDPAALEALLSHPAAEARELAISLLRRQGPSGLWGAVRPLGPGPSPRGAELMGRFLGVCEDAWEESMGLAVEGLLRHQSGVVARRALKLLVQQGREVAACALLLRLPDAELRTPVLTALSTWSGRNLDPNRTLPAELLEERRRELRALIDALAQGPRGQAQARLAEAWDHPAPLARVAALVAVHLHALESERARVIEALGLADPVLTRAAALAARALAPGPDLAGPLQRLLDARDAEVRLEARAALLQQLETGAGSAGSAAEAQLDSDAPALRSATEPLLLDPAPEVRLGALLAAGERPDLLGALALEARLADPDPRVREAALLLLARRGRGDAARLTGALRDRWPEVRRAALEAVGALSGLEAVRGEVSELLADPAPAVAAAALRLLEGPAEPTA